MSCPFKSSSNPDELPSSSSDGYHSYLALDELLSLQRLKGPGDEVTHDEHLFIVTHQAYELWFKQILVELDSVRNMMLAESLDESKMLRIVHLLNRIVTIFKLLNEQFHVLETMTPLDFLGFRNFLSTASGFQSMQFRLLENTLGVREENRIKYNLQHYKTVFEDKPTQWAAVEKSLSLPSMLSVLEKWLERTPGLAVEEFDFWSKFRRAANMWLKREFLYPAEEATDPVVKQTKMAEYKKEKECFDSVLSEEKYNVFLSRGDRRISFKAFQGAMMISLYRDEPRFHQPFHLLRLLMDIDSLMTKWRYNHVTMVQRMIGNKMGTGGSSGYQYLKSTVSDRYKVFVDLFNLSTYLIPREYIPTLDKKMKRCLSSMDLSEMNTSPSSEKRQKRGSDLKSMAEGDTSEGNVFE